MDGSETSGDDRRERILSATFHVLMERGYAGASTLEIARRARVSKRELYALFENKRDILATMIGSRATRMRLPLELPAAPDRPTLEIILTRFGQVMLAEVCQPAVMALYRLAVAESERSPEVAAALHDAGREATVAALGRLLARAQAAGLIGPGDSTLMAGHFLSLLWGDLMVRLMLRVAAAPPPPEQEARASRAVEALFRLYPAAPTGKAARTARRQG